MAVMQHSLFRRRVLQIAPFGFFPPLFVNAAKVLNAANTNAATVIPILFFIVSEIPF